MTPLEIAQLKQRSTDLREALKTEPKLWRFLREGVTVLAAGACCQCATDVTPLLQTPYNGPYDGWCLACALNVFQSSQYKELEYYDPYRDPKSPQYDAVYDNNRRNAVYCWVPVDGEHPEMA